MQKNLNMTMTESSLINSSYQFINLDSVNRKVKDIISEYDVQSEEDHKRWLLEAIKFIDLTTLSGDDTRSNVTRLCIRAAHPLNPKLLDKLKCEIPIRTAAVCVYPNRVADAYSAIKQMGLNTEINIASVATGFPSGLFPFKTRLQEIQFAVQAGASEIDVVLDRSLALMGKWDVLFHEVKQMKYACGEAHMKVILGVGELGTMENVYKASMLSMIAGADFIKTSTGKEAVNATLPVGLVMCRAIGDYYMATGRRVGLKPAGGLKTAEDAVNWMKLVYSELGTKWLDKKLFRIGASSLLDNLEASLEKLCL